MFLTMIIKTYFYNIHQLFCFLFTDFNKIYLVYTIFRKHNVFSPFLILKYNLNGGVGVVLVYLGT